MRWLVRLTTPPGGLVLDPFTGSGSTGAAVVLEGARFVGSSAKATTSRSPGRGSGIGRASPATARVARGELRDERCDRRARYGWT